MKKLALLMALILTALLLTGCGSEQTAGTAAVKAGTPTISKVPEILNQTEYLLYQNVFYSDFGGSLEGQKVEKRGILGKIQDAFGQRTRYYVWGYLDTTKCCDWQWEIVPKDEKSLPPVGSLVIATGTFRADENSLDGYWIVDVTVKTEAQYIGDQEELNMRTLSGTLERVQILNILYRPEYFEGKRFIAYGRIAQVNVLQDPYYDGSWQIDFSSSADCPAIGTDVVLRGKVANGILSECALEVTQF